MRLVMPWLDVILDAAIITETAGDTAPEMTHAEGRPLPYCRKKKSAAS